MGEGEGVGKHGDSDHTLTLSIYQPQLLRVLKTLEIIGIFNQFNEGALALFYARRLEDAEIEKYMDLYQEWHGIQSSTVPAEKQ